MKCQCRNCYKEYESEKARGEWRGFCSAKCQHAKAKELGYSKSKHRSEYEVLSRAGLIGDVPVEAERVQLRKKLGELRASLYGSPTRIAEIMRLLKTKLRGT